MCVLPFVITDSDEAILRPFPSSTLPLAARIPEDMLSTAVDYIVFVSKFAGQTLDALAPEVAIALLRALLAFLQSPTHVRSPHLRASFGNVSCDSRGLVCACVRSCVCVCVFL